jgi:MFS family permease
VRNWPIVAALGLTQIIGYGTLYYSFSILAPAMARDLAWPVEWVFGALSIALLLGGLTAPIAGRWIDAYGAGRVMAIGSAAAAAALAAFSLSPGRTVFVLVLITIEVASTLVQYSAAFALLVQRQPDAAQRNITYLTLIAGFASTIFWPITTALHAYLSWQQVYLIFAVLNLFVCLPIHYWLALPMRLEAGPETLATPHQAAAPAEGKLPLAARRNAFLLMAVAFAFQSFVSAAILVHMLPMLGALGLGVAGVTVGTLFGPAQVMSRFINMLFGRNLPQLALAIISAVLFPAAIAVLVVTAPSFMGALAFAVVFGLGSGLYSIVGGTLPLSLFGSAGYGARQGQLMAVRLIVSSAAPFAFAMLMEKVGVKLALTATALSGCGAVLAFTAIGLMTRRHLRAERRLVLGDS